MVKSMKILLTDEEVEAIPATNFGGNVDDLNIARAQLKKVVQYIDENFYIGVGCDGKIEYEGDYMRWEALKKGAGL